MGSACKANDVSESIREHGVEMAGAFMVVSARLVRIRPPLVELAASRLSVIPVVRPPAMMHDCNDKDTRRFEAVENTKGEPIHETSPNVCLHDRPGSWVSGDIPYGRKGFEGEVVAEAGFTVSVVLDSRARSSASASG